MIAQALFGGQAEVPEPPPGPPHQLAFVELVDVDTVAERAALASGRPVSQERLEARARLGIVA